MRILDRYIGTVVAAGIGIALLIVISLDTFVALVKELDDIGRGRYGFADAMLFLLLTTPYRIYQFFPLAALLGAIGGLGILANNSELTVMRAAGVSVWRIAGAVLKTGLALTILVSLFGEFIAPYSEQYAQNKRSLAIADKIALKTRLGFWVRDGNSFVNIRNVLPGGAIGDVYIYEFDADHRLRVATHAKGAQFENGAWRLRDIAQSEFKSDTVESRRIDQAAWGSLISPSLLNVVVLDIDRLSISDLWRYIGYLAGNKQDSDRYELALSLKLLAPFATAVMLLLAVPFVFGTLRSVSIGQRVLAGFMVGLLFHLLNQTFSHMGLAYDMNPLFSAVMPIVLFGGVAWGLMRRFG